MNTPKIGLMKRGKLMGGSTPSTKEAMYHYAQAEALMAKRSKNRRAAAAADRAHLLVDDEPIHRAPTVVYVQAPGPKPEKKSIDYGLSLVSITDDVTTNTSLRLVNGIQTGSGFWNRIGRKVLNKSLRIKINGGWTYNWTTTTCPTNLLRFIVLWDADPSHGAIPPFNQIFAVTDQTGTTTANMISPLKVTESERYRVLRDKLIYFNAESGIGPVGAGTWYRGEQTWVIDEFIPLKDAETDYYSNSNPMTNADMEKGSIYVVLVAESNVATAGAENFLEVEQGLSRLRFVDP